MPRAVEYVLTVFDQITAMDELLQMSIIEVIKLDCKKDSVHRVSDPARVFEVLLILSPTFLASVYFVDIGTP